MNARLNLLGALVFLAATVGVSALGYSQLQHREIQHRYLSDALEPVAETAVNINWLPPETLSRPVSEGDKALIGKAISRAWQRLAIAQATGDADLLLDAFSGVALERASLSVSHAKQSGGRMAVLFQEILPVFYHRDGSLFQAETEFVVIRYFSGNGDQTHMSVRRDKGVLTLLNETTGWRVFSYELRDSVPLLNRAPAQSPGILLGMNYYPAGFPWREFWNNYDSETVERDFALIKELGANSVRIFLERAAFLDPERLEYSQQNLRDIIRIAETENLSLVPTLFDLKGQFGPGTWGADAVFLANTLPILATSSAVAMIDLKNEPDLDFPAHGRGTIIAWLTGMLAVGKEFAPLTPFTIGWSSSEAAEIMHRDLDVVSYHEYATPEQAPYRLAAIRALTGTKPVYITEIGESSFGLALGLPGSPDRQAARLDRRIQSLASVDGVFIWTLHDFPNVDASAVGRSPWVQRLQGAFGLIDAHGNPKPAFEVVTRRYSNFAQTYSLDYRPNQIPTPTLPSPSTRGE